MTDAPERRQSDARISVLEAEVTTIKNDVVELRSSLKDGDDAVKGEVKELQFEIHEMRTDLARRPTWAVATFIGLLSSACVGMGVALLAGVHV